MLGPPALQTLQAATDRPNPLLPPPPSASFCSSRQLAAGMHREAIVALWAIPDT